MYEPIILQQEPINRRTTIPDRSTDNNIAVTT